MKYIGLTLGKGRRKWRIIFRNDQDKSYDKNWVIKDKYMMRASKEIVVLVINV